MPFTAPKVLLVAVAAACLTQMLPAQTTATYTVGTISEISTACTGQNAEVEQAVDTVHGNYVYEAWIGCGGIGFSRSTDGGSIWSKPLKMPGSAAAWDPTVAVAPDGTVYVGFNTKSSTQYYPVVDASVNFGESFTQSTELLPPNTGNFGDRIFLATGSDGTLYATWDYSPNGALDKTLCAKGGSCSYSAGDYNIVMQTSTDRGLTFGPMTYVSANYPTGGGIAAPLIVEPDGQIDVYYMDQTTEAGSTDTLTAGNGQFTLSLDGGTDWTAPLNLAGTKNGKTSLHTWWIDGAIGIDTSANLYAVFDTQGETAQKIGDDIGFLTYSTNHGTTWSAPIQVPSEILNVPHIMAVAGGSDGIAYVAWLSPNNPSGYSLYLRTYSLTSGWLSDPFVVSTQFGSSAVWPGDTIGITTVGTNSLLLSWGSAVGGSTKSNIFVAPVQVTF